MILEKYELLTKWFNEFLLLNPETLKIFLTSCSDSWIHKKSEFEIESLWNRVDCLSQVKQKYDNFIFSSPKSLFFEIGKVKFGYSKKG
jgi:hypothetical protein